MLVILSIPRARRRTKAEMEQDRLKAGTHHFITSSESALLKESREKKSARAKRQTYDMRPPSENPDEEVPKEKKPYKPRNNPRKLTLEICQEAARERGGECLSTEYRDIRTKMKWRCGEGHEWETCFSVIRHLKEW